MNTCSLPLTITHAISEDAPVISELLAPLARQNIIVPRPPEDILRYLKNFLVARLIPSPQLKKYYPPVGAVALREYGKDWQEIRSLIIDPAYQSQGVDVRLVQEAMALAKSRDSRCVFALTLCPDLFLDLGFKIVEKEIFPAKVWTECNQYQRNNARNEIAVKFDF